MTDRDERAAEPVKRQVGSGYVLESLIGSGAMGEVWRATTRQGDAVAIKLLRPEFTRDPAFVARFLQEAQILTRAVGPNLVKVRDLVAEGSSLAIVMDLVEGPDLRTELSRRGTLPAALAGEITFKILSGLAAVHAAGVVHRDLKPENVLLSQSSNGIEPMITDFGVSRIIEEVPSTRTTVIGTPEYIAPEVADGGIPSAQSDLYAVGVLLYELLVGVTPFAGGSPLAVMRRHVEQAPGRPAGLPDALWAFIQTLLAKDPAKRPESARAAQAQLHQLAPLLSGPPLPKLATPPVPVAVAQPTVVGTREQVALGAAVESNVGKRRKRHRVRNALIAVVALALIGGGAVAAISMGVFDRQDTLGAAAADETSEPPSLSPSATTRSATPSPTPSPTPTVPTTVPGVTGLLLAQATTQLENAGYTVVVNEVVDETVPDNRVSAQVPGAGEPRPADDVVTLSVSRRPVAKFLADWSPVEGDASTGTLALNGQQYVHALYWRSYGSTASRSVQYDLGRHYRTFRALAGVGDESYSGVNERLEVIADGRIVWSGDFTLGQTAAVEVDVTGVLRLELRQTSLAALYEYKYPAFADAQILGVPSEVPTDSPSN